MGKMFTITEGLENMGALSTGGQGSVYKAKRIGEIIVAVKLLPTPIVAENNEDRNYKNFQSEVEKLKKVNEEPNPHVVKILDSGITESGSLPYIEMEFIEGPDLAELLKPPHDPVFTIREIIKVADQLANALCHCHSLQVRHGDIKSNNVKWNRHTGNYILLDFGLAVMSNEQRRSSLQHAGAVEFMAPEQSEGILLFQSDIYSYGIILYELLTGTVPFPLKDNGHYSRNAVMIAHQETDLPDPLELRKQRLPASWSDQKKELEMQVPEWLLNLILKSLKKNPAERFANGIELYNKLLEQKTGLNAKSNSEGMLILQSKNDELQAELLRQQEKTKFYEQEIASLKQALQHKELELNELSKRKAAPEAFNNNIENNTSTRKSIPVWLAALIILLMIGGLTAYLIYRPSGSANSVKDEATKSTPINSHTAATHINKTHKKEVGKVYTLATTYAFFHDLPNQSSIRKANINIWNNARLTALDERNGFIYVIYKNDQGQVSKGWLDKRDLKEVK